MKAKYQITQISPVNKGIKGLIIIKNKTKKQGPIAPLNQGVRGSSPRWPTTIMDKEKYFIKKLPVRSFLIFTKLAVIQIIVEAFLGEQLFVRALFNDVTFIHN